MLTNNNNNNNNKINNKNNNNNDGVGTSACGRGNPSAEHMVSNPYGVHPQSIEEMLLARDAATGSSRRVRQHDADHWVTAQHSKAPRSNKRSKRSNDESEYGEQCFSSEEKFADESPSSSLVDIVAKAGGEQANHGGPIEASNETEGGSVAFNNTQFSISNPEIINPSALYGLGTSQAQLLAGMAHTAPGPTIMAPGAQYQQVTAAGNHASFQAQLQPSLIYAPMEVGAQQQYLQGYLSGLQQAKVTGTQNFALPFSQQSLFSTMPSYATAASPGGGALAFPFTNSTTNTVGQGSHFMSSTFQQTQVASQAYPFLGSLLNNQMSTQQNLMGSQVNMGIGQGVNVGQMLGYSPVDGFPMSLPQILGRPDDAPNLTNHQMLLRLQIEVFEASEDDSSTHTRGRNKPVMKGQVGVRCKHCKHLPVLQRQKGSTYFPNFLMGIYQAAQNMNTVHMQCGLCTEMPDEVKRQFIYSMCNTKVHQSGAGRHYWARSAKKLGLVDTEKDGIRFVRNLPNGAKVVETPPPF